MRVLVACLLMASPAFSECVTYDVSAVPQAERNAIKSSIVALAPGVFVGATVNVLTGEVCAPKVAANSFPTWSAIHEQYQSRLAAQAAAAAAEAAEQAEFDAALAQVAHCDASIPQINSYYAGLLPGSPTAAQQRQVIRDELKRLAVCIRVTRRRITGE